MIDNDVGGDATSPEIIDRRQEQVERRVAPDTRQDDQSWMNFLTGDKLTKIDRVLGDDNPVFGEAPRNDDIVTIAQPAVVTRMKRIVRTEFVETVCEERREAFVDK